MLLDTSAWIEFLQGTEKGAKVNEHIKKEELFASLATIPELVQWCLRTKLENAAATIETIKQNSQILAITEHIGIRAGELNYQRKKEGKKWGMMDSIIVATAQVYGLKILTKDNAFRDLAEAEVL